MGRNLRCAAMAAILCVAFVGLTFGQQGFSVGFGSLGGNSSTMFNLFGSQGSTRGIGSVSSSVTVLDGHSGYFAAGVIQPFVTDVIPVVGNQPRFTYSGHMGPMLPGRGLAGSGYGAWGQSALAERIARLESGGEVVGAPRARSSAPTADASASLDGNERSVGDTLVQDRSTATDAVDSITAIRREREAAKADAYRVAADHFAQAARADAEGKSALATYHYKIARRDGDEAIRRQADEQLDVLAAEMRLHERR